MSSHQHLSLLESQLISLGQNSVNLIHEIKNPLAIILSQIDSLRLMIEHNQIYPQNIDAICSQMEKTIQRVTNIIDSVQSLNHKENRKEEWTVFTLNTPLKEALYLCENKLSKQKLTLQVKVKHKGTSIYGHQTQISQLIANCLNNAIDAVSNLKHPWIRIISETKKDFLYLSIIDSGEGIPESVREKMFDNFFTTKKDGEGTGVGLYLCKKIALDHGGTIWVDPDSKNTRICAKIPIFSKKPKI